MPRKALRSLYHFGSSKCDAQKSSEESHSSKIASSRSALSVMLAVASTVLFSLCEFSGGISAARSMQLFIAAFLCTVLAAVHTHAVLGKSIEGWRIYQPFCGGTSFVLLQVIGWIPLGFVTFGCLCASFGTEVVPSIMKLFMLELGPIQLGIVQLLAQVALLFSLGQFSNARATRTCFEKGIPLWMIGIAVVIYSVAVGSALYQGGGARRGAGYAILALMLALQTIGLHYMWTLTWNFLTICCLLIECESAIAIMACIGICSICAPWYIGRFIFRRHDFCERAMIGQSSWLCEELLCHVFGPKGWPEYVYFFKICAWPLRLTFWHFDTVLHLLAAMVLLQDYAWSIRPIHSVGSALVTCGWFWTLFYNHKIMDTEALRGGHLRLVQWGQTSLWEPVKVAQIYVFKSKHIVEDNAWEKSIPGFASIIIMAHIFTAVVAALPNSGDIFYACGGGGYISKQSIFYFGAYCMLAPMVLLGYGFVKLLHVIYTTPPPTKDD